MRLVDRGTVMRKLFASGVYRGPRTPASVSRKARGFTVQRRGVLTDEPPQISIGEKNEH